MARRVSGSIRYDPNYRGLGKIMTGRGMEAMLRDKAQGGKPFAEAIAPVDTGDYKSRFRVASASRGAGRFADRAAGYLYNDSDHAAAVEFQNDARVLGRTVDAIENSP